MKKSLKYILALLSCFLFILVLFGCGKKTTITEGNPIDNPTEVIDHFYSNDVSFEDTGTSLGSNKFLANKVAKLKLKSVTDGDTAVFHLDGEEDSYTSPIGNTYSYITVRFLGIDTPESTSAIDPWGKAASNYVKQLLTKASGIIVDASDIIIPEGDDVRSSAARRDSNGSRWLAYVWYTNDNNTDDFSKYRLLQLDVIEECYSRYTGNNPKSRYVYEANSTTQPKLYARYQDQFGGLRIHDVLFEAEIRMDAAELRRIGNEVDPNYDYSKKPKEITIKEAIVNFDQYEPKGAFIAITGVITRFVGPNFYLADAEGYALYVYMGINGNSIEGDGSSQFEQGDTINIRGRLAEYGGQKQLSDVVFKKDTFIKITDESKKIAMPTPVTLTGNETLAELNNLIGKLIVFTDTIDSIGSESKDLSYTIYLQAIIKELEAQGAKYKNFSIRVNGNLAPGYPKNEMKKGTIQVTGIMSVYFEMDYQKKPEENFPSYQIVVGNKPIVNQKPTSEIIYL